MSDGAYGIAVGPKGRVGVALPFEAIAKITTFGVTIVISVLVAIIYGFSLIWTPLAWGITIWWLGRLIVKTARAYRAGRMS